MSLVGRTVTLVDDETGGKQEFQFLDTPLNRWTGGLYSACDAYGLGAEESMALFMLLLSDTPGFIGLKVPGVRRGMEALIKRGWVVKERKGDQLLDGPEIQQICATAEAAMHFGETEGTA